MGCGAFTVSHILPSQMITICIVRRQVFFRRRCIFVIFTMAYFRLAGFRIGARGSRRFFRGLPLPISPAAAAPANRAAVRYRPPSRKDGSPRAMPASHASGYAARAAANAAGRVPSPLPRMARRAPAKDASTQQPQLQANVPVSGSTPFTTSSAPRAQLPAADSKIAVSYTHLTLPTNSLV